MAIHDGEDDADHLQSAAAFTVRENSPPLAVTDWLDGLTSYLHGRTGGGGGSCETVTVGTADLNLPGSRGSLVRTHDVRHAAFPRAAAGTDGDPRRRRRRRPFAVGRCLHREREFAALCGHRLAGRTHLVFAHLGRRWLCRWWLCRWRLRRRWLRRRRRRLRRRCRRRRRRRRSRRRGWCRSWRCWCRRWRCRCGRRRGRWCSRRFRCGRHGRGRRGHCRSFLHDVKYLVADPDTALSRCVASIGGHRVRDRAQRHPLTEGHGDPVLVGGRVPAAPAGHARVEAASVPRHDLRCRSDRQVARGGGRCRRRFDRAAAGRSQRQRTSEQEQARVSIHVW